jgi:hypothetical protein
MPDENAIEIRGLTKQFGASRAVDGVSFAVRRSSAELHSSAASMLAARGEIALPIPILGHLHRGDRPDRPRPAVGRRLEPCDA